MLISKTENEEQNMTAVHSTQPVCPNCGAARESILEQVPSPASFIISFVSLFYFGIWCIFIIPLVFQSTKMIIKRCYYCNQELEKRKYFQLPNINDQVLQFRFGNCIIVVSRKYALILLTIIISLFFYFEYIIEKEQPQIEANVYANKSWVDFLQFCGKFQFVDNGLKARHQFESYFKDKIVSWKGDYIQTKPNHDPNFDYNYWVYLKMQPTESSNDLPDIIIGVRDSLYQIQTFQKLEKGKPIHFEAKFLFLGSESSFHILELKQLTVVPTELVEDLKNLPQFTLDMDRLQVLKRAKLQDSFKHKIHMYNSNSQGGINNIFENFQTKNINQKNDDQSQQNGSIKGDENISGDENKNVQEKTGDDETTNQQNVQEQQFDPQSVNIRIDESIRQEIHSKDSNLKDSVVIEDDNKNENNE